MTAHFIGGLVYDLDDQPIGIDCGRSSDGHQRQQLVLAANATDELAISLTTTTVERIDELIEALHRIRDTKTSQALINSLPEVA